MKRFALPLLAVVLLSLVPLGGVSGATLSVATIGYPSNHGTYLKLSVDDTVVIGSWRITFYTIDPNWAGAPVVLKVQNPYQGIDEDVSLYGVGSVQYFPKNVLSPSTAYFVFKLIKVDAQSHTIDLQIGSPLKTIVISKTIANGSSFTLPSPYPAIEIKTTSIGRGNATFSIRMPSGSSVNVSLKEGSTTSLDYRISNSLLYANYMQITLVSVTSSGATINVKLPNVPSVNVHLTKYSRTPTPSPGQPTQSVVIYEGYLYTGEKLPVNVSGSMYYIQLKAVIPNTAKIAVYRGNKLVDTLILQKDELPRTVKNAPFMIAVKSTDAQHGRVVILLYGPPMASAVPILRPANLKVTLNASPLRLLLGEDMVVSINVHNLGKSDAYQIMVYAPLPAGFRLVSYTKTWSMERLPAFEDMPALIYVLKPTKVGSFTLGKVKVTYYDDQSIETGTIKTVYSNSIGGVVYAIPNITIKGTLEPKTTEGIVEKSPCVYSLPGGEVNLKVIVSALGEEPSYEFINDAKLTLTLPNGTKTFQLGTLRAGDSKTITLPIKARKSGVYPIYAKISYVDPIGERHVQSLGLVAILNSKLPDAFNPSILMKYLNDTNDSQLADQLGLVVAPYMTQNAIPKALNESLAVHSNSTELMKNVTSVVSHYYKPSNPWLPLAIIFIIIGVILLVVWLECRKKLSRYETRKKKRREGGLPKKEENENQSSL